jgi:hypothetical protein
LQQINTKQNEKATTEKIPTKDLDDILKDLKK